MLLIVCTDASLTETNQHPRWHPPSCLPSQFRANITRILASVTKRLRISPRKIHDGPIRGGPSRAIAFHLVISYLADCISWEILLNFPVPLRHLLLSAQSWISSNFNCQEHREENKTDGNVKEENPNGGLSSAGLNDLWSVRKLFLISGNGTSEKSRRSRFADRLAQYCFICANFGRPFRIFFSVSWLVLSLSGDPLHFQQFLLDSISTYVSRLSRM